MGMFAKWPTSKQRLLLFVPQQIMLFLGTIAAINAVILGQYGDTAVYPRGFIGADQSTIILISFFHFWAVMNYAALLPHERVA